MATPRATRRAMTAVLLQVLKFGSGERSDAHQDDTTSCSGEGGGMLNIL
jgi:hypothetical protein